jgi:acylglycerol lipase
VAYINDKVEKTSKGQKSGMVHFEGEFQGYKGINLFHQYWLPDSKIKAVLLILHGLADHSSRFNNLVNRFLPEGYAIYGYDQRGHGRSPGLKGYIDGFSCFVNDLDCFLKYIKKKHPENEIYLVGHSVGGLIATNFAVFHQAELGGLILSAPTTKPGASVSKFLIMLAPLLSLIIPKVGLYTIDALSISKDPAVVQNYIYDPLVYRGKIRARLGIEILKTMQDLPDKISRISLPLLIMHGSADRLSEPEGSRILYDRVSSIDKTLKIYDGFYHEIFNEPGYGIVLKDMENWLETRVTTGR